MFLYTIDILISGYLRAVISIVEINCPLSAY